MKLRILIVAVTGLAGVTYAFSQTPAKDAYKAIESCRRTAKGTGFEVVIEKTRGIASSAVSGVDPATLPVKDALDFAKLYDVLGDRRVVRGLLQRYLSADTPASDRFSAQVLLIQSCCALGDCSLLEQTLSDMSANSFNEICLLTDCAKPVGESIAKAQGEQQAILVLDSMQKRLFYADMDKVTRDRFPSYKAMVVDGYSRNPKYKLPSDTELFGQLKAECVDLEFDIVKAKASVLAEAGDHKSANATIDSFARQYFSDALLQRSAVAEKHLDALLGVEAPPLVFDRKYGDFTSLKEWRGKVVMLDFFGQYCSPCKASFPDVRAMYDDLHSKGLEVLGLTGYWGSYGSDQNVVDRPTEFKKMGGFLKDHGITWPVVFGWNPSKSVVLAVWGQKNFLNYGVGQIPMAILIGRGGKVIATEIGYSPEQFKEWREKVEKALSGN